MDEIIEQIKWYENNSKRKDDDIIRVNLKLINDLVKEIENSEDRIFIDKIISVFCEIVDIQKGVINDLDNETTAECSSRRIGYISNLNSNNFSENEINKARNPYMPPEGGFKTDDQLKKAFANYLQFHIVTRTGKPKNLSQLTAYDYVSRIRVLWEVFLTEWEEGKLEEIVQFSKERVVVGTLINVYNNIDVLQRYVEIKMAKILDKSRETEKIKYSSQNNPLNNPKNLANTKAALARFEEFRNMVLANS